MNANTEASTIAELALSQGNYTRVEDVPLAAHHKHAVITSLERLCRHPKRAARNVCLSTAGELVAYLQELIATDGASYPVIFATTILGRSFTLFPDYHKGTELSWLDHRVSVQIKTSRELALWKGREGNRFGQAEFAEFLDENVVDIVKPAGAEMLTMASTLEATRTEVFKSAVRVDSGAHRYTWNTGETAEGSTVIPDTFYLGIPVFDGDKQPIEIKVRLFHRIADGKIVFYYQLHRLEDILDKLWEEKVGKLREAVRDIAQVFEGSGPNQPEAPQSLSQFHP